jgi:hypothetical protein
MESHVIDEYCLNNSHTAEVWQFIQQYTISVSFGF